ncbi:hypothetical protein Daus18300_010729 [Diaporthe australafricana]|uniref:Malate dehydrogenase n=1 Tax=Diaporthe australafricana TaxID=127596 RepID=A0ABR3WA40_9PEZI
MHFSETSLSAILVAAAAATGAKGCTHDPVDLTINFVALGHGIQNYTCTSQNATATFIGALAVLYDITPLHPGCTGTSLSVDDFNGLSAQVLWDSEIPLNLVDASAAGPGSCLPGPCYQADSANPFPASPSDLALNGITAKFLGLHYFDAESSPTFDLVGGADTMGLFFSGTKTGEVEAPSDADRGVLATGAVKWLQLGGNGRGLSKGIAQVYRVVTAGGAAPACSDSGANGPWQTLSVPYAAQYWFYSP